MRHPAIARTPLEPAWEEWLAVNIQRGCSIGIMVKSMLSSGLFDMEGAVTQLRDHGHPQAPAAAVPRPPPRYTDEPPRLFTASSLPLSDRIVRATLRMERPIVALLEGMLTDEECDALIAAARPRLDASTAVNPLTGESRLDERRTSRGMFFQRAESPLIAAIDARAAQIMNLPESHGEGIQTLHYNVNAMYTPHWDYFDPAEPGSHLHTTPSMGGQRVSTLIMYLNDVPAGGETLFPQLNLSVVPRRGMALYFEYTNSRHEVDARTLHGGMPVKEGEKWIATKWMREAPRL